MAAPIPTFKRNWMLLLFGGSLLSFSSTALADLSPSEQNLINDLDHAFKSGVFDMDAKRKRPDGSYSRLVSTGDAIAKETISSPLNVIRNACASSGGNLTVTISGGKDSSSGIRTITVGGERLTLARREIWSVFSSSDDLEMQSRTLSSGFRPYFASGPFADRATRNADSDPPFGLFACVAGNGETLWAAAIMPDGAFARYDLPIRLTPITADWIRNHNKAVAAETRNRIESQQARLEHERVKAVRLRSFRAALEIGSQTNCGIVIGLREPLVQVQLPSYAVAPGISREFWVRRDELTDDPPPTGCRFGN